MDDKGKTSLEEATIIYLNKYNMSLIEIVLEVPKSLYDLLEIRKDTTRLEKERIREYVLVQICHVIAKVEIDRILKENKKKFRSKSRVNRLMIEKIEEVHKETEQILREILLNY